MIILHLLALAFFDVAIAAAGGWLLWINAGSTVVNGSIGGNVLAMAAMGILIVLRQLYFTRFTQGDTTHDTSKRHRTLAMGITIIDAALLIALIVYWLAARHYLAGWLLCFASALLLISAAVQLLVDMLIGQHRPTMLRDRSLVKQRLLSVEIMRLFTAGLGIIGIVAAGAIHEWQSAILNPLLVMVAVTLAGSTAVWAALRALVSVPRAGRSARDPQEGHLETS